MCSFVENLAGPFSTLVSSFNSFLLCADSDGLTFLNFTPFSLCIPVPAVKLRAFQYHIIVRVSWPAGVKEVSQNRVPVLTLKDIHQHLIINARIVWLSVVVRFLSVWLGRF